MGPQNGDSPKDLQGPRFIASCFPFSIFSVLASASAQVSILDLLEHLRARLADAGFSQVPQLASSVVLDLKQPFSFTTVNGKASASQEGLNRDLGTSGLGSTSGLGTTHGMGMANGLGMLGASCAENLGGGWGGLGGLGGLGGVGWGTPVPAMACPGSAHETSAQSRDLEEMQSEEDADDSWEEDFEDGFEDEQSDYYDDEDDY